MCKENMYDNFETANNVVNMGIKKAKNKSIDIFLFGILGFILGPLIIAYLLIVLEIYRNRKLPKVFVQQEE